MKNPNFRNAPRYRYDTLDHDQSQLALPLDLAIDREVYWLHGEQVTKKRIMGLGTKVVTELITDNEMYHPKSVFIDASSIGELRDPNLRYALRFADAAEALGWMHTTEFSMSGHFVTVIATDAGVESRFISAAYSGRTEQGNDTFIRDLYNCAPEVNCS